MEVALQTPLSFSFSLSSFDSNFHHPRPLLPSFPPSLKMAAPGPHFYNLTLSPPQSISHAIVGSFSGLPKSQEIVVARGTRIELLKPDASSGKIETVLEMEVFGTVRSLAGFRLTGGTKGEFMVLRASRKGREGRRREAG